eukprot:scaffold5606_cov78-Phaeocystis_antarctica.AAC.1
MGGQRGGQVSQSTPGSSSSAGRRACVARTARATAAHSARHGTTERSAAQEAGGGTPLPHEAPHTSASQDARTQAKAQQGRGQAGTARPPHPACTPGGREARRGRG